jgi:hypothetical protein
MAQVYSVNVVGYVNVTLQPSEWALLANPLDNGDNSITTVLQLPTGSTGVIVYGWDKDAQGFVGPATFIEGLGWLGDTLPALPPGAGFFTQNATAAPVTFTFVGEVLQGSQTVPIKAGAWSMVGSKVPIAAPLGDTTDASSLMFPGVTGDICYLFDQTAQGYSTGFTYIEGLGWLGGDSTSGPTVPVAGGMWIFRPADAGPDWTRTFNVQ